MHACVCAKLLQLCLTLFDPMDYIIACQALLSMGFSWQEYWGGLLCPSLGDLPDPGIEPTSPAAPALPVDSVPLSHWGGPYSVVLGSKSSLHCIAGSHRHGPLSFATERANDTLQEERLFFLSLVHFHSC